MVVTAVRRSFSPFSRRMTAIVLAFLMGLPTLAGATDYVERQFGEFHGWRVYWSAQLKGCYVEKELPNRGYIRFGRRLETGSFVFDILSESIDFAKTGEDYGSELAPYTATIELHDSGVAGTRCTCAYDWGGVCKHGSLST